jgi:hypothetical protein
LPPAHIALPTVHGNTREKTAIKQKNFFIITLLSTLSPANRAQAGCFQKPKSTQVGWQTGKYVIQTEDSQVCYGEHRRTMLIETSPIEF